MNISLPNALKEFVDHQATLCGYGTSGEYIRELIRRDQQRVQLRSLLLEGVQSAKTGEADAEYFEGLRNQVRQ